MNYSKQIISIMVCTIIGLCLHVNLSASHLAGGSIRYDYVGVGSSPGTHKYKITVNVIRDCNGIPYSPSSLLSREKLWARCSTSGTVLGPFNLAWKNYTKKPSERHNARGARDISDICRTRASSCQVGTISTTGYEMFYLEYEIELPACDSWELAYASGDCCRNAIANFSGSGYLDLRTHINTAWKNADSIPNNSAPSFADELRPMPSSCIGQDINYGVGTVDPDGDSLRFEFSCARSNSANGTSSSPFSTSSLMTPINGASCARPINGIQMDAANGKISFRAVSQGKFIIAFYVYEYERCTGVLKGKTYREVQFSVNSCSNKVPVDRSGITNLQGATRISGSSKIRACNGSYISWIDTISDPDVNDTLYFKSNVDSVLINGKYTVTSIQRNLAAVKFEGRVNMQRGLNQAIYLDFDDNRCDYPGHGLSIIEMEVVPGTSGGQDQYVCQGDTARVKGIGGSHFAWKSLSGDALVSGVNWFPDTSAKDTHATALFIPTKTTVLELTSSNTVDFCGNPVSGQCTQVDTLVIHVPDSFSIQSPSIQMCHKRQKSLGVITSNSAFGYKYKWTPSLYLNSDTVQNPIVNGLPHPMTYRVEVTSDSGCLRSANAMVEVSKPFPQWNLEISDTLVCLSDTIEFKANGKVKYDECGINVHGCQGTPETIQTGSGNYQGTITSSNSPSIFGSSAYGVKNHFLYRASDLRDRGMEAGPINAIGWEITALYNNTPSIVNRFSIRIQCTSDGSLPSNQFENTGFVQVYNPKNILTRQGWNTFNFDNEYVWDGTSNLLIEVCWDNITFNLNGDHLQSFDSTNYSSCKTNRNVSNTNILACTEQVPQNFRLSNVLPRTNFSVCGKIDNSKYQFTWSANPSNAIIGASNTDSLTARTVFGNANKFTLMVSDSTGECRDTLQQTIKVVSVYNAKPIQQGPFCIYDDTITLGSLSPGNTSYRQAKWSGAGIVDSKQGRFVPGLAGIGKAWIKLEISGDQCGVADSTEFEVKGLPDPSFSLVGIDTACQIKFDTLTQKLVPVVAGGYFSGSAVDSILNSSGHFTYFVDGRRVTVQPGQVRAFWVDYKVTDGCYNDTSKLVHVASSWDTTYLGIMDHKQPYKEFALCATAEKTDTFKVRGENPIWSCIEYPNAVLDNKLGILDPRIIRPNINNRQNQNIRMIVESDSNYFCPNRDTIEILLKYPPEFEIIGELYCDPWIKEPNNRFITDTVFMRIPKGPNLTGHTGNKELDPNGFNASDEVMVWYASKIQTGYPDIYDQVANQYVYNKWDGSPWMTFPNIARFRPVSLTHGKLQLAYQLAMMTWDTEPDKHLCFERDTAYIMVADTLSTNLLPLYDLCGKQSVTLDPGKFNATYQWSTGSTDPRITVSKADNYLVQISAERCIGIAKTQVINCTSVEENLGNGVEVRLFPNPTSGQLTLQLEGIESEKVDLSISDLLGKQLQSVELEARGENQIDISNFNPGVYLFTISSGDNFSTYRVIVE